MTAINIPLVAIIATKTINVPDAKTKNLAQVQNFVKSVAILFLKGRIDLIITKIKEYLTKNYVLSFLFFILIMSYASPISAAVYVNNSDTGINTLLINNQNHITKEDAALIGHFSTKELIPIRLIADQKYIRWDNNNVYINDEAPQIERLTIGQSYQQRPIEAIYMTPPNFTKTILATFAVHGFEDHYAHDGIILTQVAKKIIDYYSENTELLHFTRIIIIPCVNPDGAYAGTTNNGFGRCNAQGIDINRDFDFNWGKINSSRYKTGEAPFASVEARILRDLVEKETPDIVLDFHGWLDCVYGDPGLKTFFNLGKEKPAFSQYKSMQGYFAGWATQYSRAALVEYKYASVDTLTTQTIQAINKIIKEDFYV